MPDFFYIFVLLYDVSRCLHCEWRGEEGEALTEDVDASVGLFHVVIQNPQLYISFLFHKWFSGVIFIEVIAISLSLRMIIIIPA